MALNQYNPYTLEGKTILITGASSGIGAVTAVECSKMGANVIINGRNEQRLQETYNLLESNSCTQKHALLCADLTNEEDLASIINQIESIDGLVNNAGVNRVKPVTFIQNEDMEFVFHNNTFASVNLTRLLLKKKKINKNSSIVFTSSVSAFYNAPGRALYAGSKAAITSFMRSFAVELADKKIRANAVHPGMVETKMIRENLTEEERQKDMLTYPLKRYGKPEEVAWAIIYLLSDASAWVTGSSLTIDGGFLLK
jgi:NAD(P)-dependent dehydrogenase (short-subunit alcohol dehydrogenase family)